MPHQGRQKHGLRKLGKSRRDEMTKRSKICTSLPFSNSEHRHIQLNSRGRHVNGNVHRNMCLSPMQRTLHTCVCHHIIHGISSQPIPRNSERKVSFCTSSTGSVASGRCVSATCKDSHETTEGMEKKESGCGVRKAWKRKCRQTRRKQKRHKAPRLFDVLQV